MRVKLETDYLANELLNLTINYTRVYFVTTEDKWADFSIIEKIWTINL